jgi:putative transposase
MARPLRREYPGAAYHLTFRGNETKPVFETYQDRTTFLNTFRQVSKRYHLDLQRGCISSFYHKLHEERPIFQGRYKSILIQKDSHLGLCYTSVSGIINKRG